MTTRRRAVLAALLLVTALARPQGQVEFTKANRDKVICAILADIARKTGGTTSAVDAGSGKLVSDMDVSCKFTLRRPDGTIDNDLTSRFFQSAHDLGLLGDFRIDEKSGSIRSERLDTAVHDAKNAVPDFHCALPLEEFKVKFMAAVGANERNADAYFTAGGNQKQVTLRRQSRSRLRVFQPDGKQEDVIIDREKRPDEYARAMKKYFEMNPEEVLSRAHARDLFGDAFDAYRQARDPSHENDKQNIRGDPKYNTRIINDFLEMTGYPANWQALSTAQKQEVLRRLFPSELQAAGREKISQVLDASFAIYTLRDLKGGSVVGDQSDFKAFSETFQRAAIASLAEKRLLDLLNPNITLQDLKDHAQALAQKDGRSWNDLSQREKLDFLNQARQEKPDLMEKLKFAAAGELAVVFKSLEGMDSDRADRLKEQVLAKVPPGQKDNVQTQLELAMSYLRDPSNRKNNGAEALRRQKDMIEKLKREGLLTDADLAEARKRRLTAPSLFKLVMSGGGTVQAYQKLRGDWEAFKARLDPTLQKWAGTLDKLDKAQSILNLIKVWQDSGGDAESMKRALYMEVMSRRVPGYDSYQLYKMWRSGDPQAREEVQKSLVFQGLTLLPGGAIARTMKLAVDVVRTGLDVTIGYELGSLGRENVESCLQGGSFDSILKGIPGRSVEERRKNLYPAWKKELNLEQAFRRLHSQKKIWDDLGPSQKAVKAKQDRYNRTVHAFYEQVHRQITARVENYLAETGRFRGEIAAGTKAMLTDLLFADFTNGLNREIGQTLLADAERQAREADAVLDSLDDIAYGLFAGGLNKNWSAMGENVVAGIAAANRWEIRFDQGKKETGGATPKDWLLTCFAQVVPPLDATFEERTSDYELYIPAEGRELQNQIVNGRVKFRLRHAKTKAVVTERDFEFKGEEEPPSAWLTMIQKTAWVEVRLLGCAEKTWPGCQAEKKAYSLVHAWATPLVWQGPSFSGTLTVTNPGPAGQPGQSFTMTISGAVDPKLKTLLSLVCNYASPDIQEKLVLEKIPLQFERTYKLQSGSWMGNFKYAAENEACRKAVIDIQRSGRESRSLSDLSWSGKSIVTVNFAMTAPKYPELRP